MKSLKRSVKFKIAIGISIASLLAAVASPANAHVADGSKEMMTVPINVYGGRANYGWIPAVCPFAGATLYKDPGAQGGPSNIDGSLNAGISATMSSSWACTNPVSMSKTNVWLQVLVYARNSAGRDQLRGQYSCSGVATCRIHIHTYEASGMFGGSPDWYPWGGGNRCDWTTNPWHLVIDGQLSGNGQVITTFHAVGGLLDCTTTW